MGRADPAMHLASDFWSVGILFVVCAIDLYSISLGLIEAIW